MRTLSGAGGSLLSAQVCVKYITADCSYRVTAWAAHYKRCALNMLQCAQGQKRRVLSYLYYNILCNVYKGEKIIYLRMPPPHCIDCAIDLLTRDSETILRFNPFFKFR